MNSGCKISLLIMVFTMAAVGFCSAQPISVTVKGSDGHPLPGAAVQLTRLPDSASTYQMSDKSGLAKFDVITNTLYLVRISFLGFETLEETILIKPERTSFDFRLKESAIAIGDVTIAAQRPLIRQEDDKMIIDPMPLVNTSTNTLEVLEKTPGLYVDPDGGIYLSNANTAAIYINGRELKMSNQDISTLLRNLPPGSVDRIEVMRTPSTKYDASSTGGIINIVLKKGVKIGRFGSLNAGMNQGFYGNRFAGINFNNSGEKTTSYITANYNHNGRLEEINSVRELTGDTALNQSARSKQHSEQAYLGYGISYDPTEKTNLSYDGRINASFPDAKATNLNVIENAENIRLFENDNFIDNKSVFLNINQDFGIIRKFDTSGSMLDTKISYSYNRNSSAQEYQSNYIFPFNYSLHGEGDNLQERHFINVQSDLTWQLPYKIKLETGIKSNYQDYQSRADYFIDHGSGLQSDTDRSVTYHYTENLNAAYAQASRKFGKWFTLKAGLRMEHTYMSGLQTIPADTSFVVNRVDFFPYIYISRPILRLMGIELQGYLIYRRTIRRPDYQDLNPYIKYVDPFLYETGNPALKPQFTDNYEVNISFDDIPVFAFGQNYTTDIFSAVVYPDEANPAIAVRTYDNLGRNTETYLRAMGGIPPGKKYFFALGGQYNYTYYRGIYEGNDFTFRNGSWRFFTFHSLNLLKNTKFTLSGFMMVNGNRDFYVLENFGMLNLGLTQTFFKKKLTVTLSARDVLRTMKVGFRLEQGSIITYGDRYTDNQRFGINIRYSFGLKKKEERNGMMQFEAPE